MSSGVGLSPACLERYQELKLGKKYRYIIFKIDNIKNPKEIIVDEAHLGGLDAKYDDFLENLDETEGLFAVYDFEFDKGEGKRNKICFFIWTPDNAPVKSKMVYASSKDSLRRALVGIGSDIQGTDLSEVAYDTILEKVSRGA